MTITGRWTARACRIAPTTDQTEGRNTSGPSTRRPTAMTSQVARIKGIRSGGTIAAKGLAIHAVHSAAPMTAFIVPAMAPLAVRISISTAWA